MSKDSEMTQSHDACAKAVSIRTLWTSRSAGRKGFTLIELTIALAIISIVVAIAIPNFISVKGRAQEASLKANMHTLLMAVEEFSTLAEAMYPADLGVTVEEALEALGFAPESDKSVAGAAAGKAPQGGDVLLPRNFVNPISKGGNAFESNEPTAVEGCTYYVPIGVAGKLAEGFIIKGYGKKGELAQTYSSGQ